MIGDSNILDPAQLLSAYAQGIFPMADDANDNDFYWVRPKKRGIIPLDSFHIPKSLTKKIRQAPFEIRFNTDFKGIIEGCAESKAGRETTWINKTISDACYALFKLGFCHTVEAWDNGALVGGLYGISLGQAFFGESMFSRKTDASKICLVYLVENLKKQGFQLLDTQFITPHLAKFGAIEIPQSEYEQLLEKALKKKSSFL